jgi:hypothetical protein
VGLLQREKGLLKWRSGGVGNAADIMAKHTRTPGLIDRNPSTLISDVSSGVVLWEVSYRRWRRLQKLPGFVTHLHFVFTVAVPVCKQLKRVIRQPDPSEWLVSSQLDRTTRYSIADQRFSYPFDITFLSCNAVGLSPPFFEQKNLWGDSGAAHYTVARNDTLTLSGYKCDVTLNH